MEPKYEAVEGTVEAEAETPPRTDVEASEPPKDEMNRKLDLILQALGVEEEK